MLGFFNWKPWHFLLIAPLLFQAGDAKAGEYCSGFNSQTRSWGITEVNDTVQEAYCEEGAAFLSSQLISGKKSQRTLWNLSGSCCPLPEGSLTNEHVYVQQVCPLGFVITGGRGKMVRCTKIDLARYSLEEHAITLKAEPAPSFLEMLKIAFGGKSSSTSRARLPIELRFGVGRLGRALWLDTFCVGYPWGSPLTALGEKGCDGFIFMQLKPKTQKALPASTSCRAVEDIYSQHATCLR